jgi:hypothetical protein
MLPDRCCINPANALFIRLTLRRPSCRRARFSTRLVHERQLDPSDTVDGAAPRLRRGKSDFHAVGALQLTADSAL